MRTTLTGFLTLDGVYQGPGAPDEDREGGFERGGWSVPYGDEDLGAFMGSVVEQAGAFLFGRRTYELFASHWPRVTDPDDVVASRLNTLPKYVATSTLTSADWAGSHLVTGDVLAEVAALKRRDGGELQIHGSGALAGRLLEHGLVDRMHLLWFPVVVGTGKRLFAEGSLPGAFRLTGARTTGRGVVIASYDLTGRPGYGS